MDKNEIANEWMHNFIKATADDNLTINDYSLAIELIEKCVGTINDDTVRNVVIASYPIDLTDI